MAGTLSGMIARTHYTISQAARRLNVSRVTIYHWIQSGRLLPVRSVTRQLIPAEQIANIQLGIQ